jgi:hypothetical protein
MEFQSKIFVRVSNPGARLSDLGGILLMSSIVLIAVLKLLKASEMYSLFDIGLAVIGIALVLVGRSQANGNMFNIGLSDTNLVVTSKGIRLGEEFYPLDQVSDLDFWINGYDGMKGPQFKGYRNFRNQGRMSGADNKIHFRANGKKHLYQFYLPDQDSMNELGQVFRLFYEHRVPFGECNRGGPTFLFRQVRSKNELEEMKRREGFA